MVKNAGLISAVKPALDDLGQTDFRASQWVLDEVLNKAGESPEP
jgi:predicted nucleic acid-binding protein